VLKRRFSLYAGGAAAVAGADRCCSQAAARLQLSRAKHRSLPDIRAWRAASRRCAVLRIRRARFFRADGGARRVGAQRRAGFHALAALFAGALRQNGAADRRGLRRISDLQFTVALPRAVPIQPASCASISRPARFSHPRPASRSPISTAIASYDLTGSYGVNVFGYDFYKDCIERGSERVRELGPVLGAYHPVSPTTSSAAARFPGSTRSRSTCRAPKR
jgi:glutamate-1-semialdehyde 2,1-aminomutase